MWLKGRDPQPSDRTSVGPPFSCFYEKPRGPCHPSEANKLVAAVHRAGGALQGQEVCLGSETTAWELCLGGAQPQLRWGTSCFPSWAELPPRRGRGRAGTAELSWPTPGPEALTWDHTALAHANKLPFQVHILFPKIWSFVDFCIFL